MDGILEYLKRRANSTFLTAATAFWIIFHWEGICTLLFTDQQFIMDKYGLLKNEYLNQYFFGFRIQEDVWGWLYEIIIFLAPFVLAYLYVWWLPKFVTNPCYKRETEFKVDRRIIKLQADEKVAEQSAKKTKAEVAEVNEQTKLTEARRKAVEKNPETKWQQDFRTFQKEIATWRIVMDNLTNLIYEHQGDADYSSIEPDEIMICDVNGLINIDTSHNRATLTEKGKFFLKKYKS